MMRIKILTAVWIFGAVWSLAGAESVKAVLFPFREAQISSRVDSTLKRCSFRVGVKFRSGDVLLELDEALFALQYQRMQSQERFASAVYADKKELRAGNFTSDFEVKKAQFEYLTVKNSLEEARLKLSYCRIRAPFAGKIVEVLTQEHEAVRRGDPLLKIIDDSSLLAVMNVPLKKVKPVGSSVRIRLDAGGIVSGKVYELSPQANHRTGTLRVRVLIDNREGKLWAGMTGELCDGK